MMSLHTCRGFVSACAVLAVPVVNFGLQTLAHCQLDLLAPQVEGAGAPAALQLALSIAAVAAVRLDGTADHAAHHSPAVAT